MWPKRQVDPRPNSPYFPPALARERIATADRPRRPEATARQRDAPSGAKSVLRMFDSLSERLSAVLDRLTRRGALSEADVGEALREVRRGLAGAGGGAHAPRTFP